MILGTKPALPALRFKVTVPQPDVPEVVIGLSDKEHDEEDNQVRVAGNGLSDKCKVNGESDGGEKSGQSGEGERGDVELVVDIPARVETRADFSESGKLPPKGKKQAPAPAKPVVSQPARSLLSEGKAKEDLKVGEEEAKLKEGVRVKSEPTITTEPQNNIVCTHTLKCFLSMLYVRQSAHLAFWQQSQGDFRQRLG
ncbi:hypothetical protein FRC09_003962 [Ceratobasidium sp. 395]|nr:hypothetical protein FRC09_003962 [Ceratobasidium sp. 395]